MTDFRFDCVFYYVSDLDRAIAFYEGALGFRLSSRDDVARFLVDGVLVELVPTSNSELLSGRGNARLAVSVEDIDAAIQVLRAKGLVVSDVRRVSNGQLASLQDPDGNEVVLWQYAWRGAQPSRRLHVIENLNADRRLRGMSEARVRWNVARRRWARPAAGRDRAQAAITARRKGQA